MVLTDIQKAVGKELAKQSLTVEELQDKLGLTLSKTQTELQALIQLQLIEKTTDYPTKYMVKKEISQKISSEKQLAENDPRLIKLNITIESQSPSQTLTLESLKNLEVNLRKEKSFQVYDVTYSEVAEEQEHFSAFMQVYLSVKDFRSLVRLVFFYGPTVVEVLKPDKITLNLQDLQDSLVDMSNMVQNYVEYISQQSTQKEILEFNQKMLKNLKHSTEEKQ